MPDLKKKLLRLRNIVRSLGSTLVAYSGGVDSSLLLKICVEELGTKAIAVTSVSETYPRDELEQTKKVAKAIGARHVIVKTKELKDARYAANTPDRCYYCKLNLYAHLEKTAKRYNVKTVVNGTNADDLKDYRPGMKATKEFDVRSPLMEAGLTKKDIVTTARALDLPNWDKPASPCLASRIPYGTAVTLQRLKMIAGAENSLRSMGFSVFRVRYHNECARVEVAGKELKRAFSHAKKIATAIKKCGFKYVALDLDGYRSGSLNEGLKR